jgi:hypothetical protein
MRHSLIRLTHSKTGETYYFPWVSSCDAPSGVGMTEAELWDVLERDARAPERYLRENNGPEARREVALEVEFNLAKARRQFERVKKNGTSFCDEERTGEEFAKFNRAGENEQQISTDEIIEQFLRTKEEVSPETEAVNATSGKVSSPKILPLKEQPR